MNASGPLNPWFSSFSERQNLLKGDLPKHTGLGAAGPVPGWVGLGRAPVKLTLLETSSQAFLQYFIKTNKGRKTNLC